MTSGTFIPQHRLFRYRGLLAGLLSLAVSLMLAAIVLANMGPPWRVGDLAGEPLGVFRQLHIEREWLNIDLRPLAQTQQAEVSARYQIRNDGSMASVDLVFVSPGISTGQVRLDDRPIPAQRLPDFTLPDSWRNSLSQALPPSTWNVFRYPLPAQQESALQFKASLPSGQHTLQVSYQVSPFQDYTKHFYSTYQIGYVLAPARSWASFGQFELQIHAPPDWYVYSSLAVQPVAGHLRGVFTGLPADALGVEARPNIPSGLRQMSIAVRCLGWLLGLGLCYTLGRWLAQQKRQQRWPTIWSVVYVLGLAIAGCLLNGTAVLSSEVCGHQVMDWFHSHHISPTTHYRRAWETIILVLLAALAGLIVSPIVFFTRRPKPSAADK